MTKEHDPMHASVRLAKFAGGIFGGLLWSGVLFLAAAAFVVGAVVALIVLL